MSVGGSDPVAVTVVKPQGDVVLTLLVNPKRCISSLKTQIEGMVDVPAGTQVLRLEGGVLLDDDATLAALGVYGQAKVVLDSRPPLLSGRLTSVELQSLLSDPRALDEAIDAYKADPQYSAAELDVIVKAVSATLLGTEVQGNTPPVAPQAPSSPSTMDSPSSRRFSFGWFRNRSSSTDGPAVLGREGRATLRAKFTSDLRQALAGVESELRARCPPDAAPAASAEDASNTSLSAADVRPGMVQCASPRVPALGMSAVCGLQVSPTLESRSPRRRSKSMDAGTAARALAMVTEASAPPRAKRLSMPRSPSPAAGGLDQEVAPDQEARCGVSSELRTKSIRFGAAPSPESNLEDADALGPADTGVRPHGVQSEPMRRHSMSMGRSKSEGHGDMFASLPPPVVTEAAMSRSQTFSFRKCRQSLPSKLPAASRDEDRGPWHGAGSELRAHLHRRFTASESFANGDELRAASGAA